jgi:hypothetical protein
VDLRPVVASPASSASTTGPNFLDFHYHYDFTAFPHAITGVQLSLPSCVRTSHRFRVQLLLSSFLCSEAGVAETLNTPTTASRRLHVVQFSINFSLSGQATPNPRRNKNKNTTLFWKDTTPTPTRRFVFSADPTVALSSAASILVILSPSCPEPYRVTTLLDIWHSHCFIFRPAASPPSIEAPTVQGCCEQAGISQTFHLHSFALICIPFHLHLHLDLEHGAGSRIVSCSPSIPFTASWSSSRLLPVPGLTQGPVSGLPALHSQHPKAKSASPSSVLSIPFFGRP